MSAAQINHEHVCGTDISVFNPFTLYRVLIEGPLSLELSLKGTAWGFVTQDQPRRRPITRALQVHSSPVVVTKTVFISYWDEGRVGHRGMWRKGKSSDENGIISGKENLVCEIFISFSLNFLFQVQL